MQFCPLSLFTYNRYSICTFLFPFSIPYPLLLSFSTLLWTYHAEFIEGDLSIEVSVSFDNSSINELLELGVIEIVTHHHFEYLEEFTVGDEAIVVDIVDLEGEAELLFLAGAGGQRVQSLNELKERNVTIVITIKHGDHTPNKRVIRKFYTYISDRHMFRNFRNARSLLISFFHYLL